MQGRERGESRYVIPVIMICQVPQSSEALQTKADRNTCVSPEGELHGKHSNSFNHTCVTNSSQIWWLWLVLIKTVTVSVLCLKANNHLLFMRKKRIETLKIALLFLEDVCLHSTIVHSLLLKYCHPSESSASRQLTKSTWAGLAAESSVWHLCVFTKGQRPELCLFKTLIMSTAGFVVLHCFHCRSSTWGSDLTQKELPGTTQMKRGGSRNLRKAASPSLVRGDAAEVAAQRGKSTSSQLY